MPLLVGLLFLVPVYADPIKLFSGVNDPLNDNGNISYIKIAVRDGYRIALAVFMSTQDDELPHLVLTGNVGRFEAEQLGGGRRTLLIARDRRVSGAVSYEI
jgi:hypothetical protein